MRRSRQLTAHKAVHTVLAVTAFRNAPSARPLEKRSIRVVTIESRSTFAGTGEARIKCMGSRVTRYDKLVERAKDNPVLSVLLFAGLVVTVLLSFVALVRETTSGFVSDRVREERSPLTTPTGDTADVPTTRRTEATEPVPVQGTLQSSGRANSLAQVAADSAAFSPVSFEEYVENAMLYVRSDRTDLRRMEYVKAPDGKRIACLANL